MKCLILIFLSGIVFLTACESNPYANSKIEMNTTPCFGECPEYDITINGDGSAIYIGKNYVPRKGQFNKQLSAAETKELFAAFEEANFFAFEEEYTSNISDLPTTYISFSHHGQTKKIKDYFGAPEALDKLENRLEEIANSDGWQK